MLVAHRSLSLSVLVPGLAYLNARICLEKGDTFCEGKLPTNIVQLIYSMSKKRDIKIWIYFNPAIKGRPSMYKGILTYI